MTLLRWPKPLADVPHFPHQLLAPLAAYRIATVGDLVAKVKLVYPAMLPPYQAIYGTIRGIPPLTDVEMIGAAARALCNWLDYRGHEPPSTWTDPYKRPKPATGCGAGSAPTTPTPMPMTPPNTKVRELPTESLSLHDEAGQVPEMSGDQWKLFVADVKARGVEEPLKLIPGTRTVVDGRSRLTAAREAKLPAVPVVDAVFDEEETPVGYMLRVALVRRHLTPGQRTAIGVKLKAEYKRAAKERKKLGAEKGAAVSAERRSAPPANVPVQPPEAPTPAPKKKDRSGEAGEQAAKEAGVSRKSIDVGEKIAEQSPAAFKAMQDGKVSLAEAARQAGVVPPKEKPATPPVHSGFDEICGTLHDVRPCPFCGGASAWLAHKRAVVCSQCDAHGPAAAGEIKARAAWNRRAAK